MPIPTRSQSLKVKISTNVNEKPTKQIKPTTAPEISAGQSSDIRIPSGHTPDILSGSSPVPAPRTDNAPRNNTAQKIRGSATSKHIRSSSTVSAIPTRSSTTSSYSGLPPEHAQPRLKPLGHVGLHERNSGLATTISNPALSRVETPVAKNISPLDRQRSNGSTKLGSKAPFSTYQQSFSPRKTPQRVQADVIDCVNTANSTREGGSTSSEVARLQDELFQLSLVYNQSDKSFQSFEQGASHFLREQTLLVKNEAESVSILNKDRQQNINVSAIENWVGISEGTVVNDKIRIVSGCIQELCGLQEDDGPLTGALEHLDKWCQRTASILEDRSKSEIGEEVRFVQPLDAAWQQAVDTVKRKLDFCLDVLHPLKPSQDNSSIWLVFIMHVQLAKTIQAELEACLNVYQSVMIAEEDWIETKLKKATSAAQLVAGKSPRQALWYQ